MLTFTVTVTGGVGTYTFPTTLSGEVYHRQINPPASGNTYTFYLQNSLAIQHDVHSGTGLSDFDDHALAVMETVFGISGASQDGAYVVTLWVLQ